VARKLLNVQTALEKNPLVFVGLWKILEILLKVRKAGPIRLSVVDTSGIRTIGEPGPGKMPGSITHRM
jgi:hypothetical protein